MHTHNTEELQPLIFFLIFFCTTLIYIKRYTIAITIITAPDVPSIIIVIIIDVIIVTLYLSHNFITRLTIFPAPRRTPGFQQQRTTYTQRSHPHIKNVTKTRRAITQLT